MNLIPLNIQSLRDPVTIILMISLLFSTIASYVIKSLKINLLLHPASVIKEREYYRLVTADLIHHDLPHLLVNEVILFTYGSRLEDLLNQGNRHGSLDYVMIYFFSCISGSIATTIINRKDFGFSSAGASGSLIGCMFSYLLLKPGRIAFYAPVLGAINNLYFGLICIILLSAYQFRSKNELMNVEQHFFGAVGGLIMTLILFPGGIK